MWAHATPGIPDDMFERDEGVPITKEEVRAIQISKARLGPGDAVYDVGCGSGSVTVEAALQVAGSGGAVHAVDRDPAAVALTRRNLGRFGVTNAEVSLGEAADVIPSLPEADAVLIGGTGGATAAIVGMCAEKLKAGGRIVAGTVQVETLAAVLAAVGGAGCLAPADVTQVAISKGRRTSTGTMMLARNPVTVVSARRE